MRSKFSGVGVFDFQVAHVQEIRVAAAHRVGESGNLDGLDVGDAIRAVAKVAEFNVSS